MMKKVLLIFLVLVGTILSFKTSSELFDTVASNLEKKYCPLRNFDGLPFCPGFTTRTSLHLDSIPVDIPSDIQIQGELTTETRILENEMQEGERIISGFGYDRVKRAIKFPVINSEAPTVISKVENTSLKFTSANEFLSFITKGKQMQEAGLFTESEGFIKDFVMKFSDYAVDIGVSQAYYTTHTTNVTNYSPIPEFLDVINNLPEWDPNNTVTRTYYNNIIHFWGTDIATNVNHGGVVYLQTAVKSCFGGSITQDMIKELEAGIKKIPPGELAYLKYRKLGIFQCRGGNPELGMDKIKERIESFKTFPAPIKFTTVPLFSVVRDQKKQNWLKQAITTYENENMINIKAILAQVEAEKSNRYKGVKTIHYQNFNVEQAGSLVYIWVGCPVVQLKKQYYAPHCTLLREGKNLVASQKVEVWRWPEKQYTVYIERDATTGFTRIISYHLGQLHRASNWVQKGCANIVGPYNVLYFSFCVDCLPVIVQKPALLLQKHTILDCVCPHF